MRGFLRITCATCAYLVAGLHAQAQTSPRPMPNIIYPDAFTGHAVAHRNPHGMFAMSVEVNGTTLPMVFDTGASLVVIRAEDAADAGIDVNSLVYSGRASTANGSTAVAPVTIRTLSVGGITRHDVPAIVSKPGQLAVNLLGQSFMSRLSGYKFQGDELILQGN